MYRFAAFLLFSISAFAVKTGLTTDAIWELRSVSDPQITRDAKSVTPSVTSVTSVTQASRGASRDASRVTPSRAVVQDLTAVASAVGSESSLTAAAAVLELPRTTNGQTGVTRDASLSVTSASPSVTRDASQASPGVTPSVTRDAAAMELQKVLGPVISRKFRDLLLRHELNKDAAAMWIVTVSDKLKDKRYVPEDAGQMCDDDIANPIQQGLKGVLAFMDRARLNRVVAEQEHMKSMAGLIDTRRAKDPAWWDWCVESAKQAGFANGYVFAAPHFHDPWPVEESNGQ